MANNYRPDVTITLPPGISVEADAQQIISHTLQAIQESTGAAAVSFSPPGGLAAAPEPAPQAAIYRRVDDFRAPSEPVQLVTLPVTAAGETVGMVSLAWECASDTFDPESLAPLLDVIGVTVKHAQDQQAQQQYLKALEYLGDLQARLNTLGSPVDVISALIADDHLFGEILNCQHALVALLTENSISDIRSRGVSANFVRQIRAADLGSWSFLNNHKQIFDHALNFSSVEDMPAPSPWPDIFAQEGIRAGMMMVLHGRTGLLGYLMLYYDSVHTPTARESRVIELVSLHVSAVLENLKFHLAREERAENLEKHVAVRTQELAIALDQSEEANRTKSQLLSTVAHELRRPLSVIKVRATTLLGNYDLLGKERHLEYVTIMNEEADRLDAMITSLLDMTRLESGRLEMKRERVEPLPLITALVDELQARYKDRPFARVFPAELGPIHADPERTRQVIGNLIDNASKYSPAGTSIEVGAHAWDDGAEIWVADSGSGLTREQIRRVFEPFYQINGNSQNAVGGVGLGLAICKGLIEEMGGRIWCSSAGPGQGSRFAFLLPWYSDTPPVEPETPPLNPRKNG